MNTTAPLAPTELASDGGTIRLRPIADGDAPAILAFANAMPVHDLLFLLRDIRNPKVVDAWLDQARQGTIISLVAEREGQIVGCTAMVRDELSWSAHVADIRLLIAPECRGFGLGRLLALHCIDRARQDGVEKLTVRMTPDQAGARRLFEELGFIPEALLRDQVRGADGATSDILVMALDVARHLTQHQVFGLEG